MIREFSLTPPAVFQDGDTWERDGNYLNQMRNGAVVQTWNLKALESQKLQQPVAVGNVISKFYLEQGMPGQNVALTRVDIGEQGQVLFTFGDGNGQEYQNWDAIADEASSLDSTPALAYKMIIAKSYRNDPAGVNKANFVGGQCSVNVDADQPIILTPPS